MSPEGVCLATTLWLQATCALIAPAIVLHIWSNSGGGNGAQASTRKRGDDASSSSSDDDDLRPEEQEAPHFTALGVLGEWVQERPVETGMCLCMLTWLALRAAIMRLLPA